MPFKRATSGIGRTADVPPGGGCATNVPGTGFSSKSPSTRRQFLIECSALAVTATVAPAALGESLRGREVSLERIRLADFGRQLGTTFIIHPEGGARVGVVLIEVRPSLPDTASGAADAGNERFALLFRGTTESPLEQGTYWFEHPRIGLFAMFIVWIGCMDLSHCYYQAIFNRPASPGAKGAGARSG